MDTDLKVLRVDNQLIFSSAIQGNNRLTSFNHFVSKGD